MSKIGKQPIKIIEGVKVSLKDGVLKFSGTNADLEVKLLPGVEAEIKENEVSFKPQDDSDQTKANWGTMRALSANAMSGAAKDFVKSLKIEGIGFKAAVEGTNLVLNLGFSHPIKLTLPQGVKASVEKNIITVSGADKFMVGQIAAKIRSFKKPEPYLGKGIMYTDEVVRRKAGKKVAGATAKAA
ncbi:MAG: 50S ribosomal protein L6 [Patescibacteria group bacterium]|nr:50S ribosomal protein L6 [Patescibacteria group bacterium]MCL5261917.1 50S ribosomal protein L6 [Patescibacteria group bacterium]